ERPGVVARLQSPVDLVGRGAGFVGHDEVEGVQFSVARVDGGQVLVDDFACGPLASPDGASDIDRAHGSSVRMRGTRTRPAPVAVHLCPSCGATVVPGRERCPACGHPATPTFVMPTLPDDAATVEYDFDGWDDAARAAVTDAFGAAGIAYRWEPDLKLVVAAD